MNEQLKQDLEALTCEGNTVFLPKTPLKNYALLKTTLTKACGKYKRNTFEFPYSARAVIDTLLSGKVIDFKKEFQFFATPEGLAEYMANQIIGTGAIKTVLEPSAGHGALIAAVRKLVPDAEVDAIELSELNFNVLIGKYAENPKVNLMHADFLEYKTTKKYDLIIANPPFSKNQDIDHIMKMYGLLNEGGTLITIASNSWTFGSQEKQIEFREFVEEEGTAKDLEHGTFKSSGTNVSGQLLTFYK